MTKSEQTNSTPAPPFFRAPFTGALLPASVADVTLKLTGEMNAREGLAFTAEVRRGKKLVGTIENQGGGGGTWFHHHAVEEMRWWNEAAAQYAAILAEHAEGDEFMSAEDNRKFYRENPGQGHEALADALYENAALYRDLNRKRSLMVRVNGDNDQILIFSAKPAEVLPHPDRRKTVVDQVSKPGDTVEFWIKNKGWETA